METPDQTQEHIEGQTQDQSESKAHTLPEARQITRARARDLGTLLLKYTRRHLPSDAVGERRRDRGPERMDTTHGRLVGILKIVPISLLALFAASFFWDFEGMSTSFFGKTLPLEGVLRIVSVSGMIGFLTNWMAITMLFQPRKRRPLLGQGLIPAQRERVVFRLAQAVRRRKGEKAVCVVERASAAWAGRNVSHVQSAPGAPVRRITMETTMSISRFINQT